MPRRAAVDQRLRCFDDVPVILGPLEVVADSLELELRSSARMIGASFELACVAAYAVDVVLVIELDVAEGADLRFGFGRHNEHSICWRPVVAELQPVCAGSVHLASALRMSTNLPVLR